MMRFKLNNEILKYNVFSFDFDGTLDDDFDGTLNTQKDEIREICRQLITHGKKVYIITKRLGPNHNESKKVIDLSKQLLINNIYFTNRELKTDKIRELSVEVHFENDKYESDIIEKIPIIVIHIEDPYWRDLVY